MTKALSPAGTRIPAQALAVACVVVLCAAWLSPLHILALATGSLAGALSRRLLAKVPHGTRAGPGECEVPTALLWTLVAFLWQRGDVPTPWLAVLLPFTWVGVALAVVDLHHHRLPRALTVPLVGLTLPLLVVPALATGPPLLLHAAFGAVILFSLHALVHRARPGALGRGDVIVAAPLGAIQGALGLVTLIPATLLASLFTLALHLVTRTAGRRRDHRRRAVPHAPGMVAATTTMALLTLAVA